MKLRGAKGKIHLSHPSPPPLCFMGGAVGCTECTLTAMTEPQNLSTKRECWSIEVLDCCDPIAAS